MSKKTKFANNKINAYWIGRVKTQDEEAYNEIVERMQKLSNKIGKRDWVIILNAMTKFVGDKLGFGIEATKKNAEQTFLFCKREIKNYAVENGIFISRLLLDLTKDYLDAEEKNDNNDL